MKNILLSSLVALMLFSCSAPSNEQKAQRLIEKDLKESLYNPKTYKFVGISLDSCFSDDLEKNPQIFTKAIEVSNLYKEYKLLIDEAEEAEGSMTIYAPSHGRQRAFSKHQYEKYKKEFDLASRKANDKKQLIINKLKENRELLKEIAGLGHEHSGWMATFAYSAENALEVPVTTHVIYFLDKDFNTIIDYFSERDTEILQDEDVVDAQYELSEEIQAIFAE